MFWLISFAGSVLLVVSTVIPYFTFGDDYKMMKQLGFDIAMLFAAVFGVLAASISIHEEIEGRTAVTLISKPVTRRQFLLGKFVGILMAAGIMTMIFGWVLNWALVIQPEMNPLDDIDDPMPAQAAAYFGDTITAALPSLEGESFARGATLWTGETFAHSFGLLLGFGQVAVLLSIASALATRMPFVANLVICFLIFLLGNLMPFLVEVTRGLGEGNSPLLLVGFLAQLFDAILPSLQFFQMGPAIIRDSPIELWDFIGYVFRVDGYALIYTAIVLLFGLILFEDRDLA